ncbi:MAG: hypothetical protein FJX77_11855 [Armatimonadetes bacterium]|nr:hypothetical protein [Armatimonadota bacterium]
MSVSSLVFKVRDRLVEWGWVQGPRCYLRRHAVGVTRDRLAHRGTRAWQRRQNVRPLAETSRRVDSRR